mgnify:FL=1
MLAGILLRVKFVDVLWALFAIIVIFGPVIFMIIMGVLGSNGSKDSGEISYTDSSEDSYHESMSDRDEERRRKEIEYMRDTIRSERKYMTDEEIRDKHYGVWDPSLRDQAFKEEDEPSFLEWLFG